MKTNIHTKEKTSTNKNKLTVATKEEIKQATNRAINKYRKALKELANR